MDVIVKPGVKAHECNAVFNHGFLNQLNLLGCLLGFKKFNGIDILNHPDVLRKDFKERSIEFFRIG